MKTLNVNELVDVNGGSNLGNTLIFAGSVVLAIALPGTGGTIAGIAIGALGLISGWE